MFGVGVEEQEKTCLKGEIEGCLISEVKKFLI